MTLDEILTKEQRKAIWEAGYSLICTESIHKLSIEEYVSPELGVHLPLIRDEFEQKAQREFWKQLRGEGIVTYSQSEHDAGESQPARWLGYEMFGIVTQHKPRPWLSPFVPPEDILGS